MDSLEAPREMQRSKDRLTTGGRKSEEDGVAAPGNSGAAEPAEKRRRVGECSAISEGGSEEVACAVKPAPFSREPGRAYEQVYVVYVASLFCAAALPEAALRPMPTHADAWCKMSEFGYLQINVCPCREISLSPACRVIPEFSSP